MATKRKAKQSQHAVRLSADQMSHIVALRDKLDGDTPGVRHTVSDVIRVAIERMYVAEFA